MRILLSLLFFGGLAQALTAQSKHPIEDFKDGYALKGADTIKCKVLFDSKHDHSQQSVILLLDNEELSFFAGGPITGYGLADEGKQYDYGTIDVEVLVANRRLANLFFVKKIAAGTIDLYEYTYSITTTKRTTVNGEEKPGSATTTRQTTTNYYIAKTDTSAPSLSRPVILSSFRKKDLESYISDNTEIMNDGEKRYNLKELIILINKYNSWYSTKRQ